MNENEKLRIGIVGLGKMGLLHACILNSVPNVKVVAVCEKKRSLVWYGKNLFPSVSIVDRIQGFSDLNLDAIVISTPIPSHSKIIDSVYSIGVRNLFVEKTLASNGNESFKICELAQKAGGVNMVGYMARYAVTFQKAKELMDNGTIGRVTAFKGYAYASDFLGIEGKSFLRGGVIRDLGCHVIDLAFWYFGELNIETAILKPKQPINGESSGYFKVNAPNSLTGDFDISWCKQGYRIPDYGLEIRGTNGSIKVNNDSVSISDGSKKQTWYRVDLNDNVAFLLGAPEYYREDIMFINAIRNKSEAEPNFLIAAKVDCFIDQVKKKAVKGIQ